MLTTLKSLLPTSLKGVLRKIRTGNAYEPYLPDRVDEIELVRAISSMLDLSQQQVADGLRYYREFHQKQSYAKRLGERKTLCFEEAFVIYMLSQVFKPRRIVEIGTQYGGSTRRLIDIKKLLNLDSQIFCFDIVNEVKFFSVEEAQLIMKDITNSFHEDVLLSIGPDLIYLDAHPYHLLKNVISEILHFSDSCALVIHDCGKGLCNRNMKIKVDDPNITSWTGTWERHVLAELFAISDPLSGKLDSAETKTHKLCIFGTPHGLAVILPKSLSQWRIS